MEEQKLTDLMFEMTDLVQHLEENGWCSISSGFAKGKINLFVGDGFMAIHYVV